MKESNTDYTTIKPIKFVFGISLFVFIFSLSVQLYVANTTAIKGVDYMSLSKKKHELEKEIALLKYQDSNLSSLSYIEEKAKGLGFVKISEPLASIAVPSLASLYTR